MAQHTTDNFGEAHTFGLKIDHKARRYIETEQSRAMVCDMMEDATVKTDVARKMGRILGKEPGDAEQTL